MKKNFETHDAYKPPHRAAEGLKKLRLSHMVAASENNVIGKDNHLPWNLPNDFKFFKNKTWGMPVIMGRNTYESLDKPLPGRFNIVITTKRDWKRGDVIIAHSVDEAIAKAKETDCKEIFIIGGAEVFKQSIEIVNRIYLTRVQTTLKGDAFYPVIDKKKWELTSEDPHTSDEKHAFGYTFQTWQRTGDD
jgi:dihydrofolate reductase